MNELTDKQTSLEGIMLEIGQKAKKAAGLLSTASTEQKNSALLAMAKNIRTFQEDIMLANAKDIEAAEKRDYGTAFIDRLALDAGRIDSIAAGIEAIAGLADPVGETIAQWDRPNGLNIERVRVPLGVIGIIYESRPNVTADAGALCLKSGNAVILRGGSDSYHSSGKISELLQQGLVEVGLPIDCIQIVPDTDREAVGMMLRGLEGCIDVIIPRGGKSLVKRIQEEAKVPVFSHLDGINHVYVDADASEEMANAVVLNAKMRRTGVCGAAETLLLDKKLSKQVMTGLIENLQQSGCEVRGETELQGLIPSVKPVSEEDWSTEYLEAIISVRIVDGVEGAIDHIGRYSSHHTESIITENDAHAAKFLNEVDSAIIMHNASTQFADGGEFGMGAEIGISTGKMHARGPVGVEQLTSFKYKVRGTGQTRPV